MYKDMCERVCVRESVLGYVWIVCVCVCERERERESKGKGVCVSATFLSINDLCKN